MYNENDFTWFKPRIKGKLAINIPNETNFNINAALATDLPKQISIGYIADEKVLAIREDASGISFPKSGTLKLPELIQIFTSHGMRFPARFTVIRENDLWIGVLDPQPIPQINHKKPPRRKKRPDLASLAKEAEKL